MRLEANQLYEFGPFRADGLRRLLFRDGQPVPLTSKAFDTLLVLIRNRDRVLEKDELLKTIWPNSFVEEANLAQNVSSLRKALGEVPGEHRYIATIPGRGYRFVADVTQFGAVETEVTLERHTTAEMVVEEEIQGEDDRVPARRSLPRPKAFAAVVLLTAAVVGAAGWRIWNSNAGRAPDVAATRSIAVLPFHPLDPQGEQALGLGLADAVITKLSNIRQLVVRPTSSIQQYAGPAADPWAAGRELDVEALLEGKVQQAGDRIRVTVQLLRVRDRRPLWAETFDESFTNIFAIEDAISERVAQALALKLAQGEKQRLDRRYTANLEAYRNYLDGRYAEFQFTPDGLNRAIAYFDRAIGIDPSYALAYAGLADAYTTASDWVLSPREALPKAEAAARRALEFDDGLAEAHGALAHAQLHAWKLADAGKEFARALALNPNITSIYFAYAEYLSALGRHDAATAEIRKALKIDPPSPELLFLLEFPAYLKHDYEGALAGDRAAIKAHPAFWPPYMALGYGYLAERRFPESIAAFEKARALNPDATLTLSGLAAAQARAGNRAEAMKILAQLKKTKPERYVAPFDIAVVYVALGQRDQALDWLAKAYQDQSEMMLFLEIYDPVADLRGEPRFQELVRRVGVSRN
ncbi:MAG: winged helix-turn-helix domain-containing protein [Bryobacteraceae bacterium]|jgi:DNA-binding winged helix-turn-helix (wHTH) protein/TolB-like protein/Flp pilus assembly protein TadD